jgi:Protein of unknown function (DUF3037)
MNSATGYYSLIQFCPDPSRLEAANVGVLLFSPKHCFLKARTASDNQRIRRFFGSEGHDWQRINSFKQGIEERIQVESGTIRTLQDLELFIAKRANRLRITPPRSMNVADPEKDLDQLFRELVGGSLRSQPTNYRKYLAELFTRTGVIQKLRTDIPVVIPEFNRRVEVPFGFQTTRFNLIQPVRFKAADAAPVIQTACRYAVEGESLFDTPDVELGNLQLIVLGHFPSPNSESRSVVGKILAKHKVRLYSANDLDSLIDEIRRTGKDQLTRAVGG